MAKRTFRCKKCSVVLVKEQRQEGVCQYCQLKGKIEQEIDNIQKLFEESGDPDLPRQLEELEMMASALEKKREEEDVSVKDEDTKLGILDDGMSKGNESDGDEGKSEDEEDKKPDTSLVKEETDIDDEEYAKSLPPGWKAMNVIVGGGSVIKHFIDGEKNDLHTENDTNHFIDI